MKSSFIVFILIVCYAIAKGQPVNDNCDKALGLSSSKSFCSETNQYTTIEATPNIIGSGNDVWFTFTPRNGYDLFITVYGEGNGGTLKNPAIKLFAGCEVTSGVVGSSNSVNNVTTFYVGGLNLGRTYYINVSGSNSGTFKLCLQNQNVPPRPGQDCITASLLCSMDPIRETNISGAGNNPDEAVGSCLQNINPDGTHPNTETNSVWYKWIAANNGSLVFTVTPTVITDDLDWVLYDMGTADNCSGKGVAIRCADGSGVKNNLSKSEGGGCPTEPVYHKIGLDFNATDVSEPKGCGQGQDGKVKFINMEKDHFYALLINSPHHQGNGFLLEFTDQNGVAGTGRFAGPTAEIDFQVNSPCTMSQEYTFQSLSGNYQNLKWDFGEGANLKNATSPGPFTITYATKGIKTARLEAVGANGCFTLATKTFSVGITPDIPAITVNKPIFCVKDTIKFSSTAIPGVNYRWTGPNNFESTSASVEIPVLNNSFAGVYTLTAFDGECESLSRSITIPFIEDAPIAAFHTTPSLPAKLSLPVTISLFNDSKNADIFLWDFGDGTTSTEVNPVHTYTTPGNFNISLTAFKSNICNSSVIHGTFVLKADNSIFIPNTITPNGDGTNDELVVTVTNLASYSIRIFNRWGGLVFTSKDIFDNWKGTHNGEQLPVGAYYYIVDGVDFHGKTIKQSGYINLIR